MTSQSSTSTHLVHLDGTTLEGGGQLLRLALALSSLTCTPIHVTDIRGKRGPISSPGKDGGLKPAHLAGVRWLAKATAAETQGMEAKSRELLFSPSPEKRASSISEDKPAENAQSDGTDSIGVWKDIYENGKIVRRTSRILVSTPGSISLVLQAVLPYLLLGPSSSVEGQDAPVPLRITIDGGTNVSNSPSIEYVNQVLLPTLSHKFHVPPITVTIHKRGWSTGGTVVGNVTFDVQPLKPNVILPAFNFQERGELMRMHISILAPDLEARSCIRNHVIAYLLAYNPDIEIVFPVDENSRSEKRHYLLLVAETAGGYRLGRDWLYDLKTKGIKSEETCAKLVSKVVKDIKGELKHGGCVDEYMHDQLVVFQSLAAGKAVIDAGKQGASLHTRTARWVVEKMLGLAFDENGSCMGVGFRISNPPTPSNSVEDQLATVVEQVSRLTPSDDIERGH